MDLTFVLILVVIAFVVGIFAGKFIAPDSRRVNKLEQTIEQNKQQHQSYKEDVAAHFSQSANLFGDITEKYRSLYEHMSSGAYDLCDRRSIPRELATSHVNILAVETPEVSPQLTDQGEPLASEEEQVQQTDAGIDDFIEKNNNPDELVVDVTRVGLSPLDPDSQELAMQNKKASHENVAEVINLDSQRNEHEQDSEEVKAQQAKDYAIKAKGVINHNSLNRDDVKT